MIGIDATTLEANAALRSIVRRDTGETYPDFLTKLAQTSGIETPTRADLARIDRKRPKKGSNDDWTHPHDPDAKITKLKDGRTHLAHKAEHAVDLDTGAVVGVTVQDADTGDAETSQATLTTAAENIETVVPDRDGLQEVVGDKGYHSNQELIDLEAVGIRSYISEPDRGRRNWKGKAEARAAVYRNRRRIHGARGQRLLRLRGERLERPFAHLYETGGMRRLYLRGHANILKRVLTHAGGLNLGLLMRHLTGVGTPRSLQGRAVALVMVTVPLRDRCSFGRFTWLISQALTVTYVVGEHRLYLERNCRLPESGPQETAESRGACQFQGAEQSAGFGPAVEPRRK